MFIKKELFIFLCINRQALLHLSREKIKSLLMFLRTKTCQNDFIYIYIYIYINLTMKESQELSPVSR